MHIQFSQSCFKIFKVFIYYPMSLRKPLELQQVFLPRRGNKPRAHTLFQIIPRNHGRFLAIYNCSGRLTWDVFVRDLTRQLGTPSHSLLVDSCKEGQKGALAAVCTPTLKSASKKHQKLYTSVSEHRDWRSEGGLMKLCIVYLSPSGKQPFSL